MSFVVRCERTLQNERDLDKDKQYNNRPPNPGLDRLGFRHFEQAATFGAEVWAANVSRLAYLITTIRTSRSHRGRLPIYWGQLD